MLEKHLLKERVPAPATELNEQGLEKLSEEERKAWHLLVPYVRKLAIKLSSFEGYVDPNIMKADTEFVEQMEQKFLRDDPRIAASQRRGEILEALLAEGIKHAKWLGPDTEPIIASRYDDIKNGVDFVLEILENQKFGYLALNVDVTSSIVQIGNNLEEVKKKIISGDLTEIKYFQSKRSGITGKKDTIPKVVIGIDSNALKELSLLRVELNTYRAALKKPENSSPTVQESLIKKAKEAGLKLSSHRIQVLILKEIEIQIEKYIEFANKNNYTKVASIYQSALNTIREIKSRPEAPKLSPNEEDQNSNDKVFQALQSALKDFN
ncbi:MAG: hypothetical protein A2817_00860 [Candidatus Yanofskybacteria bacterium RIFCSPHIGHO2_01_FULL_39_8b]|uniref:Uncharacterized protein n=1 Tax=Candidatus Yanofskybacteria bacterium RIFCSPHIGHO2_01_FULL_39_8b TaxID=1802659 RepID=A0A1F8EFX8_9BACT|nr:MAG: hypothetical protein A2817_00860 [Candidatus Yanofskybacteria bacterium RIFCSPHIGHO2_01_FULL_39_8b]